ISITKALCLKNEQQVRDDGQLQAIRRLVRRVPWQSHAAPTRSDFGPPLDGTDVGPSVTALKKVKLLPGEEVLSVDAASGASATKSDDAEEVSSAEVSGRKRAYAETVLLTLCPRLFE